MSTTNGLKALHDRLLAEKPEDAEHDRRVCPLCALEEFTDTTPGGSMPETFTQEDVDAAIAASTGPLQQRLSELEAQVQETEVGRAVAEAIQDKDSEISRLQEQLDATEAARTAAEAKLAETEQFWTDAVAAHEAAAELAARKERRVAEAKAAGVLGDEFVDANADRFAAMSDEDFAARLEEWRLIAAQVGGKEQGQKPAYTALVASSVPFQSAATSQLSRLTEFRAHRVDPRTLGGS